MRRFQCALLATVAAIGFASIASAADMPTKAPMMAPAVFSWTGCYVGGNVGAGWANNQWQDDFPTAAVTGQVSQDSTSFVGGAQIGCNYQFHNNFVIGIEGNWTAASFGESLTTIPVFGLNRDFRSTGKSIYDIAARFGYADNNWLYYGKAGWAGTSLDFRVNRSSDQALMASASGVRANGFVLGAGVEYGLTRNWILGIEYDYYGFTTGDQNGVQDPAFITQNFTNIDYSVQTVTARLSFLFR